MKRIVLLSIIGLLMFLTSIFSTPILNNSGTSSEDSLSVALLSLDSIGNPVQADSFFVAIIKSHTNDVVFKDSGVAATMGGLDTVIIPGGIIQYYYHRAVADIDGAGDVGAYEGIIYTKRNSPVYKTANIFSFQIVSKNFNASMLEIAEAAESLKNQDNWVAKEASLFDPGTDPVFLTATERQAIADTTEARLDISGKTVGVVTTVTNAVTLTAAERQAIADTTEARLDLSGKTIGTVTNGVTVTTNNDKTGYGLSNATITIFLDSLFEKRVPGDTATGSAYAFMIRTIKATLDSINNLATLNEMGAIVWETDTSISVSGSSYGKLIKDTSAYQGAASGLTPASIWAHPTRTLTSFAFNVSLADASITAAKIADGTFIAAKFAAGSLNGKGDWRLSSTYPSNFGDLSISLTNGYVTTLTTIDKNNFNLSSAERLALTGAIWNALQTSYNTAGTFGNYLNAQITSRSNHTPADVYAEFTSGTNEDAFKANITGLTTLAQVDSLRWFLGAVPGCKTYTVYTTTVDSLYIINPALDTVFIVAYQHPTGAAGDQPDTTKTTAAP